jgi:hypothetical protein
VSQAFPTELPPSACLRTITVNIEGSSSPHPGHVAVDVQMHSDAESRALFEQQFTRDLAAFGYCY